MAVISKYIILIGIVIINSSYFRYYDLKKIIALSSILHLNLTFQSMLSLNSSGIYCAIDDLVDILIVMLNMN